MLNRLQSQFGLLSTSEIGSRGFLLQGCLMSDNRIANVGQKHILHRLSKLKGKASELTSVRAEA